MSDIGRHFARDLEDGEETTKPDVLHTPISFNTAELKVVKLEPGDILSVKLIGDDFDAATMRSLQDSLKSIFPNNRVMVFTMPSGSDIVIEAVRPPTEPCGAVNYCTDCNCGKKEQAEGK